MRQGSVLVALVRVFEDLVANLACSLGLERVHQPPVPPGITFDAEFGTAIGADKQVVSILDYAILAFCQFCQRREKNVLKIVLYWFKASHIHDLN